MLHTIATVPVPRLIEWLELIAVANRNDVEPRLTEYLDRCRQTGYEPPIALLQLAREHIGRKPVVGSVEDCRTLRNGGREHIGRKRVVGSGTTTASVRPKRGTT